MATWDGPRWEQVSECEWNFQTEDVLIRLLHWDFDKGAWRVDVMPRLLGSKMRKFNAESLLAAQAEALKLVRAKCLEIAKACEEEG